MGLPRYLNDKEKEALKWAKFALKESLVLNHRSYSLNQSYNDLKSLGIIEEKSIVHQNTNNLILQKDIKHISKLIRSSIKHEYEMGQYAWSGINKNTYNVHVINKYKFPTKDDWSINFTYHPTVLKFDSNRVALFRKLGYFLWQDGEDGAIFIENPKIIAIRKAMNDLRKKRHDRLNRIKKIEKAKSRVYNSRTYPTTLRQLIFERDNYTCQCCGITKEKAMEKGLHLEVDHIIEWEDGGETTYENGQTLCSQCNKGKHRVKRLKIA